jgi:hypothetical protein
VIFLLPTTEFVSIKLADSISCDALTARWSVDCRTPLLNSVSPVETLGHEWVPGVEVRLGELIAVRSEVTPTLFLLLFAEIVTEYEGKKRTEDCWNKFADAFKNLKNCVAEKLYTSWITTLPDNTKTN